MEASTFSLNLVKSDSKLLEALETSNFIKYASVIPFQKPLGVLIKLFRIWLTSEAIRGRQRPLNGMITDLMILALIQPILSIMVSLMTALISATRPQALESWCLAVRSIVFQNPDCETFIPKYMPVGGGFSEMWDQSFKLEKVSKHFLRKSYGSQILNLSHFTLWQGQQSLKFLKKVGFC